MNKIEREKNTIHLMVELYSRKKLKEKEMSAELKEFLDYAYQRLDHCRFGEHKTSCKQCPIHCYAKPKRELAKKIMRWSGPRMLLYSPLAALRHMLGK